jgi:bifunctional DNA-binding transcriptional regulator/antitoxin component of YhaV-PrlF toxin-antitoxin module
MIETTQKLIGIGSSDGVTIPAKELKREGLKRGDKVEVIIRPARSNVNKHDQHIIDAAKEILTEYKQDFQNLAKR